MDVIDYSEDTSNYTTLYLRGLALDYYRSDSGTIIKLDNSSYSIVSGVYNPTMHATQVSVANADSLELWYESSTGKERSLVLSNAKGYFREGHEIAIFDQHDEASGARGIAWIYNVTADRVYFNISPKTLRKKYKLVKFSRYSFIKASCSGVIISLLLSNPNWYFLGLFSSYGYFTYRFFSEVLKVEQDIRSKLIPVVRASIDADKESNSRNKDRALSKSI